MTLAHAEDPHSCRPGLAAGGPSGRAEPQGLGRLRPADAGAPRPRFGYRGHRAQNRPDGLSHTQASDPVSRRES